MKILPFLALSCLTVIAARAAEKAAEAPQRAPTQANVAYGAHERQVLDFWKADSARPTPLLFHIHGGGWVNGDKARVANLDKYLAAGISVVPDPEIEEDPADAEVIVQIRELIETRVRPAVAKDGGDIVYRGFSKGTVYLAMHGACSGCPSSTMTLKQGIESLLKYYVPEVETVEAV